MTLALRPPEVVMRLERMGAAFATRLSFMRVLVRRMHDEGWRIACDGWAVGADGTGHATYRIETPGAVLGFVAFAHALAPEERTDRVIAEKWDATFALVDAPPDAATVARLAANVPLQEAGRYAPGDLVLSRANKSVRLFDRVADDLAAGRQPDAARVAEVGYLMRTTAVYGNGKFGLADLGRVHGGPVFATPFQAEMLTVYLIRAFTFDLVEHEARRRGGDKAVPLDRALKRSLGIGNATGLGMAPFLVGHPLLVHRWFLARETALARARAVERADAGARERFLTVLGRARRHAGQWRTDDARLAARVTGLRSDLERLESWLEGEGRGALAGPRPWDAVVRHVEEVGGVELQEMVCSAVVEVNGAAVDDLAAGTGADEAMALDPAMTVGALLDQVERSYGWALGYDFEVPEAQHLFWYVSEEKLEPRLGERYSEPGCELESRIGIAREVQALRTALRAAPAEQSVAAFLLAWPRWRFIVRRVQATEGLAYAEIRDNLLDRACMPIDILRWKLAYFGATKFDPKSDRWVRITMYQGAPLADELDRDDADDWAFPVLAA